MTIPNKPNLHKDDEDITTKCFHVVCPTDGGSTKYYSGDSKYILEN